MGNDWLVTFNANKTKLLSLSRSRDDTFPSIHYGVSWPSGLAHRTQVLVLSENQNVGSIPGSDTCVLEQDT